RDDLVTGVQTCALPISRAGIQPEVVTLVLNFDGNEGSSNRRDRHLQTTGRGAEREHLGRHVLERIRPQFDAGQVMNVGEWLQWLAIERSESLPLLLVLERYRIN